jgi:hypothetical protein
VSLLYFATPWFVTLFTNLACWSLVLRIVDLFMLEGAPACCLPPHPPHSSSAFRSGSSLPLRDRPPEEQRRHAPCCSLARARARALSLSFSLTTVQRSC